MVNEDMRQMARRLDERVTKIWRMTYNQYDMVNQLLNSNHEIVSKVEKIANLRSKSDQLKNELRSQKEDNEGIKRVQEIMRILDV